MTHSTTEITCKNCGNRYYGVLNGLFNVSNEYSATCPDCNENTFFIGKTCVVDEPIPDGAIQIMYVKKIN